MMTPSFSTNSSDDRERDGKSAVTSARPGRGCDSQLQGTVSPHSVTPLARLEQALAHRSSPLMAATFDFLITVDLPAGMYEFERDVEDASEWNITETEEGTPEDQKGEESDASEQSAAGWGTYRG